MTNVIAKHVPTTDRSIFYSYSDKMQTEIKEKLRIIERVRSSGLSLEAATAAEAARFVGKRGFSQHNIKNLTRKFNKEGWQGLVNHSKIRGGNKTQLPHAFLEYWRDLCLDHQRGKTAPTRNELIRRWRAGQLIPGYGTWRQYWAKRTPGMEFDLCPQELPEAWNYRTLLRHRPAKQELDLARFGIAASLAHMPHIIRTRDGLRPFEWVAFDDWESDFMVTVPGVDRPVRLAGIVAKDVATDMWLGFVLRPAIPRADGTKDGLKKVDMKRLVAWLIQKYGYPADYVMNLVFERGTATLPPADVRAIAEITGGMVKSHPTSMITGQVLMSGFADKAVGAARSKGWIESGFNLLHNWAAMLPGQKGLSWQAAPMELETRTKYAAKLLEVGQMLPPDVRLAEAVPFVDVHEAQESWNEMLVAINQRHDHHLEGFDKIQIWRLDETCPWVTAAEAMQRYSTEVRKEGCWNSELESPMQRLSRLIQLHNITFETVPDCALPQILADHRTVTVQKHQIKIQIKGKTYTFFDKDSPYLGENEVEYLGYYVASEMDFLYLTDGDGGFKCRLPLVDKVRQGDVVAMKKGLADTRTTLKRTLAKMNSRDSRIDKTRAAKLANEAAIERFQELQTISVAPDTDPHAANVTDVTAALNASQKEIFKEEKRKRKFAKRVQKSGADFRELGDAPKSGVQTDEAVSMDELNEL